MTPEEESRQQIDALLERCGWAVQDRRQANLLAQPGVAVREVSLATGEANLPDPDVIAAEIVEDLEAALEQFALIAEDLKR